MLTQEQIQERNAYLMNTEPDTLIMLSTESGSTLAKYEGHFPRLDAFRVSHPTYTKGLPLYEESEIWDFEVFNE